MQKIILDTNVIVSALISKGIPSKIIEELILEEKVRICLSKEVEEEYSEVLRREKFTKYPGFKIEAENILTIINNISLKYSPNINVNMISDKDDNNFIELAIVSKADYLITGNTNDFTISEVENTRILNPTEYWNNHKP